MWTYCRWHVGITVLAMLTLSGCGGSNRNGGSEPPDLVRDQSERIVFSVRTPQSRPTGFGIFTIAPDGTDRLRLTGTLVTPGTDGEMGSYYGGINCRYPSWSQDRARIVYQDQSFGLRVLNPDVGMLDAEELFRAPQPFIGSFYGGAGSSPALSHDGQSVSYYTAGRPFALYRRKLSPPGVQQPPPQSGSVAMLPGGAMPTWSPDGGVIVAPLERDGQYHLWEIDAETLTPLRQMTHHAIPVEVPGEVVAWHSPTVLPMMSWVTFTTIGGDLDPDFSPDGTKVVFARHTGEPKNGGIFVYEKATGREARLTTGRDLSPSWSPDGSRIVFSRREKGETRYDLFVVNADGSGLRRITHTTEEDEIDPDW